MTYAWKILDFCHSFCKTVFCPGWTFFNLRNQGAINVPPKPFHYKRLRWRQLAQHSLQTSAQEKRKRRAAENGGGADATSVPVGRGGASNTFFWLERSATSNGNIYNSTIEIPRSILPSHDKATIIGNCGLRQPVMGFFQDFRTSLILVPLWTGVQFPVREAVAAAKKGKERRIPRREELEEKVGKKWGMDCWERKRPQLFVLFLPPLRIVFCLCYFLLVFQTIDGVGFFLFLEKLFLSAFKNDRLLCPINENAMIEWPLRVG